MPTRSRRHRKQKAVNPDEEALPQEGNNKATSSGSQTADGFSNAGNTEGKRNFLYRWEPIVRVDGAEVKQASYRTTRGGVRSSLSNAMPGQHHTKVPIEDGLKVELVGATFIADDLADHMFGSLISTKLASEVLEGLLQLDMVKVEKEVHGKLTEVASHSSDAKAAVNEALDRALAHGCKCPGVPQLKTPAKPRPSNVWKWTWIDYPEQVREKDIVDYLNKVVDTALRLPCLKDRQRLYRFAVPHDTTHAFPLAYPPDKADMRPEFVVLPINAFEISKSRDGLDEYTLHRKWLNFTTIRLTGECKASDAIRAVAQVQRYMRGTNRVQPWQRFVTGLTVTRHKMSFIRSEGSGVEMFSMKLEHGRSSLEFVWVLLGIVLADDSLFGMSRHFELTIEDEDTVIPESLPAPPPAPSDGLYYTSNVSFVSFPGSSHLEHITTSHSDVLPSATLSGSSRGSSSLASGTTRSSRKRKRKDDVGEEPGTNATKPPPRKKTAAKKSEVKATYAVRKPKSAFGYECLGPLFNTSSLRGRNTRALLVAMFTKTGERVYAALKMSWQDTSREKQRAEGRKRLDEFREQCNSPSTMPVSLQRIYEKDWHNHVLFPDIPVDPPIPIEIDSTLRTIRAFTKDEAKEVDIEDRVLEVSWTPLRRPVQYFWSVQDFVKGLIGALRGHQFLIHIGILHRDVSENNIVLALHPDQPRGLIMDFDMAVKIPEKSDAVFATWQLDRAPESAAETSSSCDYKVERTGTIPYMSVNILLGVGKHHSYFDDVESFFYVLVLFSLSYNGPLLENQLVAAHERKFTLQATSGKLDHITLWPEEYQKWAGSMVDAGASKFVFMSEMPSHRPVQALCETLKRRWGSGLGTEIASLVTSCLALFHLTKDLKVEHEQLVGALQKWLDEHPIPPEGRNSCPFKDKDGKQAI